MSASSNSFLERLCSHFYDNEDELKQFFNEAEAARIIRLRELDREILKNPMEPDFVRVQWLKHRYGIKERQAYYDLADLRVAVGTVSSLNKEFARRELSQGLIEMMKVAKDKQDLAAYARLAKEYKAVNRLDKDDPEPVDTKMVPISARPTMDARMLNEKYTEETIASMMAEAKRLYGKRLAEDTDYEDVPTGQKDPFELSKMEIEKNRPSNPL